MFSAFPAGQAALPFSMTISHKRMSATRKTGFRFAGTERCLDGILQRFLLADIQNMGNFMKNRQAGIGSRLLFLATLITLSNILSQAMAAPTIEVDVELSKTAARRAEQVLRTNVVAYVHESIPSRIWDRFFLEQRVGDVLIDTVSLTKTSSDLQDLKRRLRELGPLVKRIVDAGGRVQLVFQNGIPRWLSSAPDNSQDLFQGGLSEGQKVWHSVPPADYQRWGEIAHAFVDYFNNELDTRGQVYYVVGSEPENYWVGTEDEWHQYYEYFVKGARRADGDAKVGGINTVGINSKAFTKFNPQRAQGGGQFQDYPADGNRGILYNWLEFCAKKNLPIDVVAWHDYPAPSPIPRESANWVVMEEQVNEWLASFGYRNVELILNDWPEWMPVPVENDSEFQAAYVVNSLVSIIEDTRVKAVYLGLRDLDAYSDKAQKRANASFAGGNGMFTSIGLAKPVFNAYSLMSMMEGNLVRTDTGDEFVRSLASKDANSVYVLLTNFIPSQRIIARNTFGVDPRAADLSAVKKAVKASGKSKKEIIEAVVDGSIDLDRLNLPQPTIRKLKGIRRVYIAARERNREPTPVNLRIADLSSGGKSWQCKEYVIDNRHANSYAARKRIVEKVRSLNIGRDKAKLLKVLEQANERTSVDSGLQACEGLSFSGRSARLRASLEPNSVHLFVLRKGG